MCELFLLVTCQALRKEDVGTANMWVTQVLANWVWKHATLIREKFRTENASDLDGVGEGGGDARREGGLSISTDSAHKNSRIFALLPLWRTFLPVVSNYWRLSPKTVHTLFPGAKMCSPSPLSATFSTGCIKKTSVLQNSISNAAYLRLAP